MHGEKLQRIAVSVSSIANVYVVLCERFSTLNKCLTQFDLDNNAGIAPRAMIFCEDQSQIIKAVSHAWDVIDWIDRLRKLLGAISGVRKKDQWYLEAMEILSASKEVRDFMQHYDSELKYFIENRAPILGSVMANFKLEESFYIRVFPTKIAGNQNGHEISIAGICIPGVLGQAIDNITLTVANSSINLSSVMARLTPRIESLKSILKAEYNFNWPESGIS